MNEAETIAETPLLGEAALREAFTKLGRTHSNSSANGSHTATDYTQSETEPPPKTVAQVLGEIVWLMTQARATRR
jgi:hypothetical protein